MAQLVVELNLIYTFCSNVQLFSGLLWNVQYVLSEMRVCVCLCVCARVCACVLALVSYSFKNVELLKIQLNNASRLKMAQVGITY